MMQRFQFGENLNETESTNPSPNKVPLESSYSSYTKSKSTDIDFVFQKQDTFGKSKSVNPEKRNLLAELDKQMRRLDYCLAPDEEFTLNKCLTKIKEAVDYILTQKEKLEEFCPSCGQNRNQALQEEQLQLVERLQKKSQELSNSEKKLKDREKLLSTQRKELQKLAEEIQHKKNQLSLTQKRTFEEHEQRLYQVKQDQKHLEIRRKDLEDTIKLFNEELNKVQFIKDQLETRRLKVEEEAESLKEFYKAKLQEVMEINQQAQEKLKLITEKEAYVQQVLEFMKESGKLNTSEVHLYLQNLDESFGSTKRTLNFEDSFCRFEDSPLQNKK